MIWKIMKKLINMKNNDEIMYVILMMKMKIIIIIK